MDKPDSQFLNFHFGQWKRVGIKNDPFPECHEIMVGADIRERRGTEPVVSCRLCKEAVALDPRDLPVLARHPEIAVICPYCCLTLQPRDMT
jgi:hypothetical protein